MPRVLTTLLLAMALGRLGFSTLFADQWSYLREDIPGSAVANTRRIDESIFVHQMPLNETNGDPKLRPLRFPTVEQRVRHYMGDWYDTVDHIRFSRNNTHVVLETGLVLDGAVEMDRLFVGTEINLHHCSRRPNLRSYCQDASSLLVAHNLSAPLLLHFGDGKKCKERGVIEVPHWRKFRAVTSKDPQPIVAKWRVERHFGLVPRVAEYDVPWAAKEDRAVFRGSLSGVMRDGYDAKASDAVNCRRSRRCGLVLQYANSSLVDARLSKTLDRVANEVDGIHLTGNKLLWHEQLRYKAIVVVEGNDVASGLKWALASQSIVLTAPPTYTSWAMEDMLMPWVHYVPLNSELTNIEERMQWVIDHDVEAQLIAQRGTLWMHDLMESDDDEVQHRMLERYQALFAEVEVDELF